MRKLMAVFMAIVLAALVPGMGLAAGVTIRTLTPFADVDFAAQDYMDMVTAWEGEHGNIVEDYSGLMDESWMAIFEEMIKNDQADVVVLPVGSGMTREELVTVEELLAAAPDCGARLMASMTEADGSVLLTPVRLNWEALYINTDVLQANGLNVPTTVEELVTVCAALAQRGVTPIANALGEWAEITLDCVALMGAPASQFGRQESLDGAKNVLTMLTQVGAFGSDPWNMTDYDAEQAFLSGAAAMRFDTSALSQMVAADRMDKVSVTSLSTDVAGTSGYGVAITRACWADDARREAAISLVSSMLSTQNIGKLCAGASGKLGQSIAEMTSSVNGTVGVLYDLNSETFDSFADATIASLMVL